MDPGPRPFNVNVDRKVGVVELSDPHSSRCAFDTVQYMAPSNGRQRVFITVKIWYEGRCKGRSNKENQCTQIARSTTFDKLLYDTLMSKLQVIVAGSGRVGSAILPTGMAPTEGSHERSIVIERLRRDKCLLAAGLGIALLATLPSSSSCFLSTSS